jgi:integrase
MTSSAGATLAAATGEDGSTPSQPKSVSILQTLNATDPNTIASRIHRRADQILVITAAYTGMRWGELTGLARANTYLGEGFLRVHPEVGALHEVQGRFYLGPPKTVSSARDIHLPPFLIGLL